MLKGYKYRIYPNKNQVVLFEKMAYDSARVWNFLLGEYKDFRNMLNLIPFVPKGELFKFYTDKNNKSISKEERASFYFKDWKGKEPDGKAFQYYKYLNQFEKFKNTNSLIKNEVIDNLKKAFDKMSTIKSGFPKFKKVNNETQKCVDKNISFTLPYTNSYRSEKFKINETGFTKVNIPTILNIKCKIHRNLPDNSIIKKVTISKSNNNWFASFTVEYEDKSPVEIEKRNIHWY